MVNEMVNEIPTFESTDDQNPIVNLSNFRMSAQNPK